MALYRLSKGKVLIMEELILHYKSFSLLFSALRVSLLPPQNIASTLAIYCSSCIMHQPDFEGLLSEEMTSLKKSLMEVNIKKEQRPGGFCLGPRVRLDFKHEDGSIKQQRWLWFGQHDASWRIREMSRRKRVQKLSNINSASNAFFFKLPLSNIFNKQKKRKMFYM